MKPMIDGAHTILLRAIRAALDANCSDRNLPMFVVESLSTRRWESATFGGATHRIQLRAGNAIADDLIAKLGDLEVDLPSGALIDLAVVDLVRDGDGVHAVIEALTLDD